MNGSQTWLEKDFYKILGVGDPATTEEIKRAYRKLAQKHHPDRNPGDVHAEEKMKEISEAHDVLGDPERRAEYDRVRKFGPSAYAGPGFGGQGAQWSFNVEDLGGVFSQFFGGGRARAQARGEDVSAEAHLSFDDAMRGVTVSVDVLRDVACDACGGTGAQPGTNVAACPTCGGRGAVGDDQGLFSIPRTCPECSGSGRKIDKPCRTCKGRGRALRTEAVRVRIPAGVRDGARIRVRGRGRPGGGAPGDLYVSVRVSTHRLFGRRGDDLTLTLPVTFTEAALGAEVKVPTLNGAVTLRIPPGTQNGRTFRIKGRGAPKTRGGSGDVLATVRVVVPERLTQAEREILERFAGTHTENPRENLEV